MPVAQTFNLKQKLLTRFQNRINLDGKGDNWSPIKKSDIVLSADKGHKGPNTSSMSRLRNNS